MLTPTPEDVLGSVMLAFEGMDLPGVVAGRLAAYPAAGVTLFRHRNVQSPEQVRRLTEAIQRAASRDGAPPLLVAADQEGGQFLALGDATTPFAGAMAMGATNDADLVERVGRAVGLELAALGVNVAYAPVCDLATNPANPAIGIRSFGDDPARVAPLVAACVRGLRSTGIATAAKHFPGLGDVAVDSHHELPSIPHDRRRLDEVELVPFRAAIGAGADLVMSAHVALPAVTGDATPATLAPQVMTGLLREALGFEGVSITDALDMRALGAAGAGGAQAVAALRAGVDLLLTAPDEDARSAIEGGLVAAARTGLLDAAATRRSLARVHGLRTRLAGVRPPPLSVVGSTEHGALAAELAARSITLVRDEPGLLPIRLGANARVAAIMPSPRDLTPADTSSSVPPLLAPALRRHHPSVESFVTSHPPTDAEIAAIRARVADFDLVVCGTIAASADAAQVALVHELFASGVPLIVAALRTPFDLASFPEVPTYLCSYGILGPTLDALADVIFGSTPAQGVLPAGIPGHYDTGHGLRA